MGFLFVVASGLGLMAWNQTKQAELNLANSLARASISSWNDNDRDLDTLMGRGCDWVHNYLTYNSYVSNSDRHLCDGIGIKNYLDIKPGDMIENFEQKEEKRSL